MLGRALNPKTDLQPDLHTSCAAQQSNLARLQRIIEERMALVQPLTVLSGRLDLLIAQSQALRQPKAESDGNAAEPEVTLGASFQDVSASLLPLILTVTPGDVIARSIERMHALLGIMTKGAVLFYRNGTRAVTPHPNSLRSGLVMLAVGLSQTDPLQSHAIHTLPTTGQNIGSVRQQTLVVDHSNPYRSFPPFTIQECAAVDTESCWELAKVFIGSR